MRTHSDCCSELLSGSKKSEDTSFLNPSGNRRPDHRFTRRLAGAALLLPALLLATAHKVISGETPAAAPSSPLRVWSSDIHDGTDGEPGAGAPNITLVGARNGTFSGKVVVGPGAPQGLKAKLSELKQGSATISGSNLKVRYALPWEKGISGRPSGNDILLESPAEPAAGKVPVWITVSVPKEAKSGVYTGVLSIEAQGLSAVQAPVKLTVQDWTLPETQDYRTWIEMLQSPDSLALQYEIPLWSDKHWELMAQSLKLIGQTGSRVLYVPLVCRTNYGNEESMVRWIKKGENQYEYDFSIMDKYLDLAEKNMGKPKIIILYVWDIYLTPGIMPGHQAGGGPVTGEGAWFAERAKLFAAGKGPPVTELDSATGKTSQLYLPRYEKAESKALWQPLWNQLRERMAKRGLDKKLMLGMMSDWRPNKEELTFLKEVSGGLHWSSCSHHASWLADSKSDWQGFPIGYTQQALSFFYVLNPAIERSYGWKQPLLHGIYWRWGIRYNNCNAYSTYSIIRQEAECNITGKQNGISHMGADFWPCLKNKAGRHNGFPTDRYMESHWHSLDIGTFMLAPGPQGPVSTTRLEVFREGIQECEARIAMESALTDAAQKAKLGEELAQRAQVVLDERHLWLWRAQGATEEQLKQTGMITYTKYEYEFLNCERKKTITGWDTGAGNKAFLNSGWADRTGKLFSAAGEVQAKMATSGR